MSTTLKQLADRALALAKATDDEQASRLRHATPDEIEALRADVGYELPPEYVEWLGLWCEGHIGEVDLLDPTSEPEAPSNEHAAPFWRRRLIPLGGDGCGNYHLLDARRSPAPVVFWDHETDDDPVDYVEASTLERFIEIAVSVAEEDADWPFDPDELRSIDPELESLKGVYSMPWDP